MLLNKRKNRNFSKKHQNKRCLSALNALFKNVFLFLQLQLSQNTKVLFFRPIDLRNQNQIDLYFFSHFNFFSFSISPKQFIEKIVFTFSSAKRFCVFENMLYTFCSTVQNLKVAKNPSEMHLKKLPLNGLKTLFLRKYLLTFDFQQKKTGDLIFLRKYNS